MKKKLLVLLFSITLTLNSQAGDSKSFFSLKSSFSVPLGDYGENNLDKGCFTTNGMSFGAEVAWFFWKNIGFGLDVNYSLHSVDAVGLASESVAVDPFVTDLNVRSEPYTMLTLMGGFYYSFAVNNRLSFQPKLFGGMMWGKTPFQLYEPTLLFPGPSYYKTTSSRDHNFAIKTGLAIKYDLIENVALGIYADYTYSYLIFGFKTAGGKFENRNRKISYLDLGIALVINL